MMSLPPPLRQVSAREALIRRRISLALSICTIIGAGATLLVWILSGYRLSNGTYGMPWWQGALWSSVLFWIVPGLTSVILLSTLPRPTNSRQRMPRRFAVTALLLSIACILLPMALISWMLLPLAIAPFFLSG